MARCRCSASSGITATGMVLFCLVIIVSGKKSINGLLRRYDTLSISDLKHTIVKRSLGDRDNHRSLNFKALGRKFNVNLRVDNTIFSSSFKAIVDNGEEENEVPVNKEEFYRGYLEGEQESSVDAHFEDGLLTAHISTTSDTYVVEPSWRHAKHEKADMIVYKTSDIMSNLSFHDVPKGRGKLSYCGVPEHHRSRRSTDMEDENVTPSDGSNSRTRRSIMARNTCPVILVADYKFYQHMGQSRLATTINYVISVLQRNNNVFRKTVWSSGVSGIGFEVKQIRVHNNPSGSKGREYNKNKPGSWNIDELLTAFSKTNWENYCLAHLFTYQDFAKGVIGLAYVASPDFNEVGGICSRTFRGSSGSPRYLNCGLSSSLNWGRRLLTAEADIVTAHEFGHNFGSDHDSETLECAPTESNGGKYIMYRTSVSGLKKNNKAFSPCSKAAVAKVLASKSQLCFRAKQGAFCGNFEVEPGEQCDPGLDAVEKNSDPCCDSNCRLRGRSRCSDSNSPCCESCVFASAKKKCREEFTMDCIGQTMCDGKSATCPEAPNLTGPDCYGKGKCKNGKCMSFCSTYGGRHNVTCTCTQNSEVCTQCCSNGITCKPVQVNGTTQRLDDGHPCDYGSYQGRCLDGKCEKTKENVLDQFLSLVKNFSASAFAKFMQQNIVGTILVFSLLFWVPASCIVHFVDKRRDREQEDMMLWKDKTNTELIRRESTANKGSKYSFRAELPRKPMYKKPTLSARDSGPYYSSEKVDQRIAQSRSKLGMQNVAM